MNLLTLTETQGRLRLGKVRIWQLTASGELPSVKIGKRRLIDEADLARFIDAHREGNGEVGGNSGAGEVIETSPAPGRRAIGSRHVQR